jgi:hypothetical protein
MSPKTRARAAAAALAVLAPATLAACSGDSTSTSTSTTWPASSPVATSRTEPTTEAPVVPATPASAALWGVTLDDVSDLSGIVASLKALPSRPTARVVFDHGQKPADYADAVAALHPVADLMGTPVDSSDSAKYSVDAYKARFQDYLAAFKPDVAIWEIGNEVNGEWAGPSQTAAAKTVAAYDLVHAAGKPTALTLYYNPGCWSDSTHEMLPWATRWIPDRVKHGVDYVFVSYYEKDCNNHRPDQAEWQQVFGQLRAQFPAARLGFGEIGTDQHADAAAKAAYLTRYYTMPPPAPGFVGGYFWWYYAEDAVPYTRSPVWAALRAAMAAGSPIG